jgi:hypothetical protein
VPGTGRSESCQPRTPLCPPRRSAPPLLPSTPLYVPGPLRRSFCVHIYSPYLWFDKRGNFHVVYHVYCLDPFSAHNECNAGHAFSTDGIQWHFGEDEPCASARPSVPLLPCMLVLARPLPLTGAYICIYLSICSVFADSGLVSFSDGTNTTFSTRERPHMIFADKQRTTPVGVFTVSSIACMHAGLASQVQLTLIL